MKLNHIHDWILGSAETMCQDVDVGLTSIVS